MTEFIDIRAFLTVASAGSFSAAARQLGIAPSVVTKRVGRLEHQIGSTLFVRSTRRLTITAEGERLRPRLQLLLSELDDALQGVSQPRRGLGGQIRVKSPTTIGTLFVGQSIARFQAAHPRVVTELVLIDRSINPLEDGFDIALGALPQSYASVIETPLCPYPRVLVAAPSYLDRHGTPQTPADIPQHDCLVFLPVGLSWSFVGEGGPIRIDVRASFIVNDSRILVAAAEEGLGLSVVPEFLVRESIEQGRLVAIMPEFPITPFWFKAMVPRNKAQRAEVAALLEHLKADFDPPPWQR